LDRSIKLAFLTFLGILAAGTVGLMLMENFSLLQAFYLTLQTVTTVGFGDVTVLTDNGRIVLILLMLGGVGLTLYFAGLMMAFLIEGHLAGIFGRRRMLKQIAQLKDHIIVCGAGRVGRQAIYRLQKEGALCVVIEQKEEIVGQLMAEGFLVINGDATHDETMHQAMIEKAKGLISALPDDALNVFITLTAKGLNPKIHVVARMDHQDSEKKLLRAGADKVISPATLGGLRMAMSILKPVSIDYIETVIHDHNIEMAIMELTIPPGSSLDGETLLSSRIKQRTGAMILSILRGQQMISNPSAGEKILAGDLLIVLGLRDQVQQLEKLAATLR